MSKSKQIKKLYLQNYSGPDIAKKLNINIRWVYRCLERQNIQRRTAAVQNKIRFEKSPLSFELKSKLSRQEKELLIAACMLYYGEGAKGGQTVDFANSDSVTLQIFLKFLKEICCIDQKKLRFYLYCFSDQNKENLIKFWCRKLKVKKSSFTKPYIKRADNSFRRTMANGVLHIRYCDVRLLNKILEIIKELSRSLLTT